MQLEVLDSTLGRTTADARSAAHRCVISILRLQQVCVELQTYANHYFLWFHLVFLTGTLHQLSNTSAAKSHAVAISRRQYRTLRCCVESSRGRSIVDVIAARRGTNFVRSTRSLQIDWWAERRHDGAIDTRPAPSSSSSSSSQWAAAAAAAAATARNRGAAADDVGDVNSVTTG